MTDQLPARAERRTLRNVGHSAARPRVWRPAWAEAIASGPGTIVVHLSAPAPCVGHVWSRSWLGSSHPDPCSLQSGHSGRCAP